MAANLINSLISQLKKDMFDNIVTKLKIFQKNWLHLLLAD